MGGMSSVSCKLWHKRNVKILFVGLDAAGKTTILYRLKLDEVVTTIPTIGFNVETIGFGNVNYIAWDVGLRSQTRALLRHYYPQTEALVFVIDSSDKDRYREAIEILCETLSEAELDGDPILILANKQDLHEVMSREEILSDLMTKDYLKRRKWEVFPVSGLQGDGLTEGLDWLTSVLTNTVPRSDYSEKRQKSDVEPNATDVPRLSHYNKLISWLKNLFV